ncbi:helix-turn-helix domain-containing protein [Pontibacillus salicampi]|uniref:Helix-turn-helix domain-containing protein n=1 Tax=Pontibacillus salicampi TaxID=1449801 RepID=A0ABV6LIA3_9BACI
MIGEKVRYYRRKQGWKQSELAAKVGLSTSQISMLEANKRKTNSETVVRIARALQVSMADLYEETSTEELIDAEEEAWLALVEEWKEKGYKPEKIRKWIEAIETLRS